MNFRTCFILACFLCTIAFTTGCGNGRPGRVTVSGKVLIDGKPLDTGYIRLIPPNARPAGAEIQSDGSFTLTTFSDDDGAVLGNHKITVNAFQNKENGMVTRYLVPAKYGEIKTTDLTVDVDQPTDSLTVNLSWEGTGQTGPYEVRSVVTGDVDPAAVVD